MAPSLSSDTADGIARQAAFRTPSASPRELRPSRREHQDIHAVARMSWCAVVHFRQRVVLED